MWYAAYGSNLHRSRLACYLEGGTPVGGAIDLPGCRDHAAPRGSLPLILPGLLYFATESVTWTGGRAFYTPDAPGETAANAYLLTVGQFSDIVAQEMYRAPGTDLDLTEVIDTGRTALGPGRYETLVRTGAVDGHPVVTCTAPWRHTEISGNPPAPAYLRHLAAGLAESHGWPLPHIAAYLAGRPGADLRWTTESVTAVIDSDIAG